MKNNLTKVLTFVLLFLIPSLSFSQAGYALFTAAGGISNTGATVVTGDIGTFVGIITGFPPGVVIGQQHTADPSSQQAASAVAATYAGLAARICGKVLGVELGGQTLTPGVYCTGAASTLNGELILDAQGNPNAQFVIQINGALATGKASKITLINGATCTNVFFQVNGAATFGEGSSFIGSIIGAGALNFLQGASLTGKAFTTAGAINLSSNSITLGIPPPVPVITASGPTTICAGGSITLSGNNNGGTFSTGATTPTIQVSTAGDFFITNSNACGTVTSNHIITTITPLAVASVITASGPTTFCAGGSVTLSGNNNGGTFSTGATTPSIVVTTSGDYFITNTSSCGTVTSNHIMVTVNPLPDCTITGVTPICQPATSRLCVAAGPPATYMWSTLQTTQCIDVAVTGDYSVTVTNNGCQSICTKHIDVNAAPVLPVITANGAITFCTGGSVTLSGNNNGGVFSTGAKTPTIIVTASGDYFITNTNNCGSVTSNHIIVTVNPLPDCTITGVTPICQPATSRLCVAANPPATYMWSTQQTTQCIDVAVTGDYSVTVTNNGCQSICTKHIDVNAAPILPVITANGAINFCAGGSVTLSGNVPGGTFSTGATTPSIVVTTSGDYFITSTNNCGSVTSNHIIVTVNPLPDCTITGNTAICQGQPTQLCAPAGLSSYLWSTTPPQNTQCITVTSPGTYSVTVTNSNGCMSNCSKLVSSSGVLPIASIITASGPTTFCQGGNVILSGNVGGVFNTGAATPTLTVTASGDYFVTNTTACGTVNSNHIIVTVNPLPIPATISANGPTRFCLSGSVVLSGNTGGVWSTGETTPTITVTAPGNYFVTLTNSCGSVKSNVIVVTVDNPPIASIISSNSNSNTICQGSSIIISGNNGGVFNTGETTPTITVTRPGDYFVTTTNGCGSINSNHIQINVLPAPTPIVGRDTTICIGGSVQLGSAPIAGHTYSWFPIIGLSDPNISNPVARPTITMTYVLTETITATGCKASNQVTINISVPDCSITSTGSICKGKTATVCAAAGASKYSWSTGEMTNCIVTNAVGIYTVTVTNALGCVSTCSKLVTGSDTCKLALNIVVTQPILEPGSASGAVMVNVTNSTGPFTYLWSNNYHEQTIEHLIAGTYTVTVTDNNCCSGIATITIIQPVSCCTNPINVGSITGSQQICKQSDLVPIVELTPASSVAGDVLEYMWMYAVIQSDGTLSDFQLIPGSGNTKNLTVFPIINSTTVIMRCVRSKCCFTFIESNRVVITPIIDARIEGPSLVYLGSKATYSIATNMGNFQASWQIFFSSNSSGGGNSITTQFYNTGLQTVRLTVSSQGCVRQILKTVNVVLPVNALASDKSNVRAYPNPAKNNLQIERMSAANMLEGNIEIFNNFGQLLFSRIFEKDQFHTEIDLSTMPTGNYILRVITSDGVSQTLKVTKTE